MSLESDWASAKPDLSAEWEKAKPTAAPDKPKEQGHGIAANVAGGLIEPLLSMGTGMLAKPVSDVAGLTRLGMEGMRRAGVPGIEERDPLTVKQDVQRALTYEPKTAAGKFTTQNNPLALLGQLIGWGGKQAGELVAPPGTSGPLRSAIGSGVEEAVTQAPMFLGAKAPAATKAGSEALRGGAERLMHSALKPAEKFAKQVDPGIDLLLEKGINVTPGGLEKIRTEIGDLNSRIGQLIANSPAVIDKQAVATRLYDTLAKFEKQVDPHADLATINKSWNNFLNHPLLTGKDIPIKTAQELKSGTYKQLQGKYGELSSAESEAQKALARGLKEEIAKAVPEVRTLNAEESRLLQALPMVERRVLISANKNPIGLGILSMNPKHIAVWMADRSELFKSLVARMLNTGSRAMPGMQMAGPLGGMAVSSEANQIAPPP